MKAQDIIHQARLRRTPSREAILTCLFENHKPVSVDEIRSYLQKHHYLVDDATIYRTIRSFIQKCLIKQIDFQEGKFRYEPASLPHHHHIICTKCGAVSQVDDCLKENAEKFISKKTGYVISSHSLEFFGLCSKCQRHE